MSVDSIVRVTHLPAASRVDRRHAPTARRRAVWGHFNDDRRLIHLKLIILGLIVVVAMALEVPL